MNYTNVHNLPAPLVQALTADNYDKVGDYSATGLIKSPRMTQLEQRHDAEISQDVSDMAWRLLGSACHEVLERIDTHNSLQEERMTINVGGAIISAKPDLLEDDTLTDFKVTSVYSFLLGDKVEWEQQLNIYAHIYREHGFPVESAQIMAILRDWQKSKAGDDYPAAPLLVKPVTLWPDVVAGQFVVDRLLLHEAAATLVDDDLPLCTAAERWERPTTWAVTKRGNKRAYRVCDSQEAATTLRDSLDGNYDAVERPGAAIRCQSYCLGAPWCNQYQIEVENDD